MRRRGFTLVELLVVIAIIAILSAIFMPVIRSAKNAAFQFNASNVAKQIGQATALYSGDYDDTAPLGFYFDGYGTTTWFGYWTAADGVKIEGGMLFPYSNGKIGRDPTHQAKEWFGDFSGFGYNWGAIGSDALLEGGISGYGNSQNPAQFSSLEHPSSTITFATSSYTAVTWEGGDGQRYDCGFISAPMFWLGNPLIDFRHQGTRRVDTVFKRITSTGSAVVLFADTRVRPAKQEQVKDEHFDRL